MDLQCTSTAQKEEVQSVRAGGFSSWDTAIPPGECVHMPLQFALQDLKCPDTGTPHQLQDGTAVTALLAQ